MQRSRGPSGDYYVKLPPGDYTKTVIMMQTQQTHQQVVSLLLQRLRCWPNIRAILGGRLVFVVMIPSFQYGGGC